MRHPLLVLLVVASCASEEPPASESLRGRIEGTVRLPSGFDPEPTVVENTTDPETCGRSQTLEDLVISETGGVQNVIVALADVPDSMKRDLESGALVLDNRQCRFRPHAAVLTVGSTLEATNSDPVLHTTHLYGPAEMNFSLPAKGARQSRELRSTGTYVVKCDLHGWMQAFLRVDDHPFHAVTDEKGRFRIDFVPAGSYTLEAWHERLGAIEVAVEVSAGETADVALEYPAEESR